MSDPIQTAVVTGAGRGFGRAVAAALVAAGTGVIGIARGEQELHAVRDELGAGFTPLAADAADEELAQDVIREHRPSLLRMHYEGYGDYEMNNHVVEYEPGRRIGWEPRPGRGHPDATAPGAALGDRWIFDLLSDGAGATVVTEIFDGSRMADRAQPGAADGAGRGYRPHNCGDPSVSLAQSR
jgi:NAD(P)-dependent dehydrogenase (short-subunit alcohol dehydrogenase family)